LGLDGKLAAADSTTAQSAGSFSKLALDLARIQTLTNQLSLFARVSGQWANKNLDSSERFQLGGPTGVRAYPVGEGNGDDGWLSQIEVRYSTALANGITLSPYAFIDSGSVKINHAPWDKSVNERSIGGAGLGVRGNHQSFSFDASLAWRTHGGDPQSDTQHDAPMVWLTAGWKF
jgi:hemolysin activation/secretion protein